MGMKYPQIAGHGAWRPQHTFSKKGFPEWRFALFGPSLSPWTIWAPTWHQIPMAPLRTGDEVPHPTPNPDGTLRTGDVVPHPRGHGAHGAPCDQLHHYKNALDFKNIMNKCLKWVGMGR